MKTRNQNFASRETIKSLNAANARSEARQDARDAARELPFGQVDAADDDSYTIDFAD